MVLADLQEALRSLQGVAAALPPIEADAVTVDRGTALFSEWLEDAKGQAIDDPLFPVADDGEAIEAGLIRCEHWPKQRLWGPGRDHGGEAQPLVRQSLRRPCELQGHHHGAAGECCEHPDRAADPGGGTCESDLRDQGPWRSLGRLGSEGRICA